MPETIGWLCAQFLFYPTLVWNILLCRVLNLRNWWDQIDEYVILGAIPFLIDVPKLKDMGIQAVLNLCEEYTGPEEAYGDAGIEQLRLPTVDYSSPSLQGRARKKRNSRFMLACKVEKLYTSTRYGVSSRKASPCKQKDS